MDWRKRFPQLSLDKRTNSRRGHEKLGGEEFLGGFFVVLFFLEKGSEG
jgi:hypothetical protein